MVAAVGTRAADVAVTDLGWSVGDVAILSAVSFEAPAGAFVGLIGPNGSGKTSLLRCVYRAQRPGGGRVVVGGKDVWASPPREVARLMAAVLQEAQAESGYSVWEIVQMGRSPHKRLTERLNRCDDEIVGRCLVDVGAIGLAGRQFSSLSGGEKQRVLLARALAQEPKVIVLDEPTNHLDIQYQIEVLSLVKALGITVVAALHDLNLAAAYCDRLVVLQGGRVVAQGPPPELLSAALVRDVYGVDAEIARHPASGRITISYFPTPAVVTLEAGNASAPALP